jgi:hypothetical protein
MAGLGHREEMVRRIGRTDGIDGDPHVAVGAVLETDRAGQTGSQLAMHLRLGGARADGAPGNQVGGVLRRDGVEEFGGAGQAQFVDFNSSLRARRNAFVDAEGVVEARIVDQALPADRGARLLEIDAHQDDRSSSACFSVSFASFLAYSIADRNREWSTARSPPADGRRRRAEYGGWPGVPYRSSAQHGWTPDTRGRRGPAAPVP